MYIYIYRYMYVCMYVCMYIYIYIYIYTCIYVIQTIFGYIHPHKYPGAQAPAAGQERPPGNRNIAIVVTT